jgi:uncharacterized protein
MSLATNAAPAIRLEQDLPVPMRDGTRLRADVFRRDGSAPHPAILVRTPYSKETVPTQAIADPRRAAARGYALVVQDVRGCGRSAGEFEPFVTEEHDGVDTVEWVARQPWCDGRVVMAGMSYAGATQWLAAAGRPPSLRAIAPALASDDYGDGWSFYAGVPEHGFLTTLSAAALCPLERRLLDDTERAFNDVEAVTRLAPWLADWLAEPPGSPYWRARSVARRRGSVEVPVLAIGGWYDIFCRGTLRSFTRSPSDMDQLLIGPWAHDDELSHIVGDANLGAAGSGKPLVFDAMLNFYDAILARPASSTARVRVYALGGRRWLELEDWPPPGALRRSFPLKPGAFAVDPDEPVPSLGGRGFLVNVPGNGRGVRDQRTLLGRPDVHEAARVAEPRRTTLAGPLRAKLRVRADVPGRADWVVTVCVERSDGALHNLCEGIGRAPADARSVTVELGDVCVDLDGDQSLVVLVAGSAFPRWPRPLASGAQHIESGSRLEFSELRGDAPQTRVGGWGRAVARGRLRGPEPR